MSRTHKCASCGALYEAARSDSRFCGTACRSARWRAESAARAGVHARLAELIRQNAASNLGRPTL